MKRKTKTVTIDLRQACAHWTRCTIVYPNPKALLKGTRDIQKELCLKCKRGTEQ